MDREDCPCVFEVRMETRPAAAQTCKVYQPMEDLLENAAHRRVLFPLNIKMDCTSIWSPTESDISLGCKMKLRKSLMHTARWLHGVFVSACAKDHVILTHPIIYSKLPRDVLCTQQNRLRPGLYPVQSKCVTLRHLVFITGKMYIPGTPAERLQVRATLLHAWVRTCIDQASLLLPSVDFPSYEQAYRKLAVIVHLPESYSALQQLSNLELEKLCTEMMTKAEKG